MKKIIMPNNYEIIKDNDQNLIEGGGILDQVVQPIVEASLGAFNGPFLTISGAKNVADTVLDSVKSISSNQSTIDGLNIAKNWVDWSLNLANRIFFPLSSIVNQESK